MVYHFRVTYEEHEDVYRDIEIKSSQSFLELHTAIQQAIGFDNSKSATFYISDDYWRKGEEISVENTSEEKVKKSKNKIEQPAKRKTIADHIDNPHQRFVYVFDPEREWTFLLELLKVIPGDNRVPYPQCIKSYGAAPKQYKPANLPPPPPEDEDEDEIEKLSADENKEPGEDAEEPSTENEDGESSEKIEFND